MKTMLDDIRSVIIWYIIGASIEGPSMRTTVNLNDELIEEARRMTGMTNRTQLLDGALRALVEREAGRRLARLGGSEPQLESIPRRQTAK